MRAFRGDPNRQHGGGDGEEEKMNRKYRHHKYTWSKPFDHVTHRWTLLTPTGAIDFHCTLVNGYDPSAGLEYHHTELANYLPNTAPDHVDCPLTGGRCWHDGTSMYAIDTLWPLIQPYTLRAEHEQIFRILEEEAERHYPS